MIISHHTPALAAGPAQIQMDGIWSPYGGKSPYWGFIHNFIRFIVTIVCTVQYILGYLLRGETVDTKGNLNSNYQVVTLGHR